LYRVLFNLFFKPLDAETSHKIVDTGLQLASKIGILRAGKRIKNVAVMGLKLENRLGLGAGFDKNAKLVRPLHALGFGHVEVGTVTFHAQPGNPKPRSFRIPEYDALINRMGFNNDGAAVISKRLAKLRKDHSNLPVIGVNIGKSKITELEDAVSDYQYSAKVLAPLADYIAVNVSSPNTPGLRLLQAIDQLEPILTAVQAEALGKPVLVKIAPDLADEDVIAVAALATKLSLAGVIATNTTISRSDLSTPTEDVEAMGAGGLSGPVLKARSIEVLNLLRANLPSGVAIVSVGGVFSAFDVSERLELGASLVQGYTGFVYEGPLWARKINRGLV
jgi:dihydroorotate dehydrogenase